MSSIHLRPDNVLRRIGARSAPWLLLAALLAAGIFWSKQASHGMPRVVHAAAGCDATSLNGVYGYTTTGFFFDNQGNTNFFSGSGSFSADGQGNLTGKETDSFSGQVLRGDAYTGTYTVNSDCTGTYSQASSVVGTSNFDFVLTDNGNGLQIVESDSGTNINGAGRKQVVVTALPSN